jgi:hypothetical protein
MELQVIQNKIYEIRGVKVMLDFELAQLYNVETKSLNLSVKRNIKRFPTDFMFQLSDQEWEVLRFQFETSKRGGRRYTPYAFTEQGVAMLSGLLNSDVAIEMNIGIMRAFVAMRQLMMTSTEIRRLALENSEIRTKLELLERNDENILGVLNELSEQTRQEIDTLDVAIAELSVKVLDPPKRPRNRIGYRTSNFKEEW